MTHQEVEDKGILEQYILDELFPAERDEFEDHYFTCKQCADEVAVLAEIIKELQRKKQEHLQKACEETTHPPLKPLPFSPLQVFCAAIATLFLVLLGVMWAKGGFHL